MSRDNLQMLINYLGKYDIVIVCFLCLVPSANGSAPVQGRWRTTLKAMICRKGARGRIWKCSSCNQGSFHNSCIVYLLRLSRKLPVLSDSGNADGGGASDFCLLTELSVSAECIIIFRALLRCREREGLLRELRGKHAAGKVSTIEIIGASLYVCNHPCRVVAG